MGYWKGIGSILLSTTSEQNSSGFPVVAAIIFVALIIMIAIWDTIKARKGMNWIDKTDEIDANQESDEEDFWK